MLENIFRIPKDQLLYAPDFENYLDCDAYLRTLGPIDKPLIAFNPTVSESDQNLIFWLDNLKIENNCLIIKWNNCCIAKIFPAHWSSNVNFYEIIDIEKPKYIWNKNSNLDKLMTFVDDPMHQYEFSPWDKDYELVWYLDPKVNPTNDKIWVYSARPLGRKIKGVKDMGFLSPDISIEYNESIPKFDFDLESNYPNYWDLHFDNVLMLDSSHQNGENLWAIKFSPNYRKSQGWRVLDEISPIMTVIYNSVLGNLDYDLDHQFLWSDFEYEHIWLLDRSYLNEGEEDIWAFKIKLSNDIKGTKIVGYISPKFNIEYNPVLKNLNYEIHYNFKWHDLKYEHVWLLDRSYLNEGEEDLWAFKLKFTNSIKGSVTQDYISPNYDIEYNPELKNLNYEIHYDFKWHDLVYKHVWYLDRQHMEDGEKNIWAFKLKFGNHVKGSKNRGYISPSYSIEYNSVLSNLNYDIDYENIKWYNLSYEHVWYLDRRHMEDGEEDLWAFKLKFTNKSKGSKNRGYISPIYSIEYNRELSNFTYDFDYDILWYDLQYKHVWYLDENYSTNKEKIWNIKISATNNIIGEKEVGIVVPLISNQLDVIFISYKEPNAEKNWQRVLEKAPWAKRVSGVSGIFNAHKEAAKLSSTDMFYVVDGDAYLVDDWKFDFQPGIFDRECAYVWSSINPVNDLIYGYGGVKLFSKSVLLKKKKWNTLDMFTGIMTKIKVEEKISCITMFDIDPFSTWRSSFRECVKLYINYQYEKIDSWKLSKKDSKFKKYAVQGANDALEFVEKFKNDKKMLLKINDFDWLKDKFDNKK